MALIEVVCLASVERPFQHLAPLNEKHCVSHYGVQPPTIHNQPLTLNVIEHYG